MDKPLPAFCCANCAHWGGGPNSWLGVCKVGAYPGRIDFDTTGCKQHSALAKPAPAVDMQSQVRGFWGPVWRQYQP